MFIEKLVVVKEVVVKHGGIGVFVIFVVDTHHLVVLHNVVLVDAKDFFSSAEIFLKLCLA